MALSNSEIYELFAVRYATHDRTQALNFVDPPDPHDAMPIDYFVWAAISGSRTFVIDTGFNAEAAKSRGRDHIRCPTEGLAAIGIDPAAVKDVIVTHFHYDHIGNFDKFPEAVFHLQDKEMAFATGRHMLDPEINRSFNVDDVVGLVRNVFGGRARFHEGDAELAPGISLYHIGGHTPGLQAVRVMTKRGFVMVASDACHLYANMETRNPYPVVFNLDDVLAGYDKMAKLVDSPDHIVPGHDPMVMDRYPPVSDALKDIVIRLDVAPERA